MTAAAAGAPVLLGIDLGSTRVKAALVGADGTLHGLGRADLAMVVDPERGRAEQDPDAWWVALRVAVRAALADAGARHGTSAGPSAICVAGHGPTLAAVDANGAPVRPAITWLDTRATRERGELEAATGLRGWALGVLPAAHWLERNEPEVAARVRWYANSWEALALRLTGVARTTLVPGGSPLPRDAATAAGLAVERLASDITTGTVIGGLLPSAAAHLGLEAGVPVVAGLVDAFASFHGARMLEAGDAIDVGGAAGGFGVYAARPVTVAGAFTTPAPLPGRYSVGGAMAATGAALDWLAGPILGVGAGSDAGAGIEPLLAEAATIQPGADGLVFLPYLAGERSPLWDPGARGAFVGLTLRHRRAHLVRAVLEAAALAIRHVAAPIVAAGIDVRVMRACGGPAASDTWNQIKADVTGFPVEVPRARETAAVGAAIVAAVGAGEHASLPDAIRSMTSIDRRFEPDPERSTTYDHAFQAYVELWPAIAPAVAGLAGGSPDAAGSTATTDRTGTATDRAGAAA